MDFPPDVHWTTHPYLVVVGGHRFGRKANMKTRAITVLSLVGVLTAGSAAAMVNTRVLSKDSPSADAQSVLSVTGVPAASDGSTVSLPIPDPATPDSPAVATTDSNSVRSLTAPTAVPVALASKPTLPSSGSSATTARRLSAFQIGAAGLVRVESGNSSFRIAEVVPGDGWTVVSYTTGEVPGTAQVVLSSGSVEVTFIAEMVGGNIVTRVESRSLSSSGGGGGGGGGGGSSSGGGSSESDDESHEEDESDDDGSFSDDEEHDEHEDDDHEDSGDDEHEEHEDDD